MQALLNLRNTSMKPNNFTEAFNAEMASLKSRAAAVGLSINELCKRAGLARATPDRWSRRTPNTVALVTKMQAEVAKAEAEKAKETASTETPAE